MEALPNNPAPDMKATFAPLASKPPPHRVRGMLLAALAYFVLPTDTVPDFFVGIGFGDDAAVLLATITLVRAHITPAHLAAAQRVLSEDEAFSKRF